MSALKWIHTKRYYNDINLILTEIIDLKYKITIKKYLLLFNENNFKKMN